MGIFTIRPKNMVYYRQRLYTKDGQIVTVMSTPAFWIKGKIKGVEYTWFDTGNYIGSNSPHPLDIDWNRRKAKKYE